MMTERYPCALVMAMLLIPVSGIAPRAAELDIAGSSSMEVRLFPHQISYAGQRKSMVSPSLSLEPEFVLETDDGTDRLTLIPFARLDADDDRRSHFDLREANWLHLADAWDSRVGIGKVFWGVTESRHLVDIVNQTDAVENTDGEDKLGQPMINLNLQTDWGNFALFALPGFRERTFADDDARLRGPKPVQQNDATYDSSARAHHVDFALRWSRTLGDVDIGVSHFHGTSREARALTAARADGVSVFVPHYDQIDQTGIDAQLTRDAWLWKFEGIVRSGHGNRFAATVAGVEYSFYQVADTSADIGVIAEYQYDGRDRSAPGTLSDDDLFVGLRWAANDAQDTSALAGLIVDRNSQETALSFEAERRLTDRWKAEIEGRWMENVPADGFLAGIKNDDHVIFRLTRYF
ncbi:MAG: hypothetical protein HQ483_15750 [Rhodospirillales bacterium]|nr:hypothetical protein [Rhodospirillales bacterium]